MQPALLSDSLPVIPAEYEARRLRVLRSYNVFGTPTEQEFDDIAALAAQICGTPVALISLVDEFKQWFKAHVGLDASETPRETSFCVHALQQTEPLIVPNLTLDDRFADNPLVTGAPFLRFYAGAPLIAPGGEVLGTLCVADHTERDLTLEQSRALTLLAREVMTHLELRRNLGILHESESRYRQLFDLSPHPMWAYDMATRRLIAVNAAAVSSYGYSRDEFMEMTIDDLTFRDSLNSLGTRHRTKNGSVLAVEISSNPMEFDGKMAVVELAMDVTGRLAAEAALRASEKLQRQAAELQATILNALPANIALLDADGIILSVNESWRAFATSNALNSQHFGVGRNYLEVPGVASKECSQDAAEIASGLRAVLARELPSYVKEYPDHLPTEKRWFRLMATPLNEYSGESAVVMHVNVTERKLAEIALEKANVNLREIARLGGMADVATSVLHNVGNVLNSVNVSCSLISEKVRKSRIMSVAWLSALLQEHQKDLAGFFTIDPRGQRLPEYLAKLAGRLGEEQSILLAEINSLARNIDHIKEVISLQQENAKGRVGNREAVSMGELVEDALQMSDTSLTRHSFCLIREFSDVPTILIERHKVLQILVNLLRNAKDAVLARPGGIGGEILVRIDGDAGHVFVSVSDNGIGIAPENLTRIFAQGFTTKQSGHGFGLHSGALAAQEMGGALSVHSDGVEKGATFTLSLQTEELDEPTKRG